MSKITAVFGEKIYCVNDKEEATKHSTGVSKGSIGRKMIPTPTLRPRKG
jgi:hypothetical protein